MVPEKASGVHAALGAGHAHPRPACLPAKPRGLRTPALPCEGLAGARLPGDSVQQRGTPHPPTPSGSPAEQ
eukprot:8160584-Alexandrium_andersonii.AAC.1